MSTGNGNNIDLGTLGGSASAAYSVNDNGQIVGNADFGWWSVGHATLFDITGSGNNIDLGTLEGDRSCALSINNNGQIVGYSANILGNCHATLFDPTGNGNNIDLGTLGGSASAAYGINDSGQIVGYAFGTTFNSHATLFDITGNGNNIDLNTLIDPTSGWTLYCARSINNNGWIVGEGMNPDGDMHAYLLTPEPATIFLLGLVSLLLRKKQ